MAHESEYVQILVDSLKKKKATLLKIVELTEEQEKLIAVENKLDLEPFAALVEKKGECIDTLNNLDSGFQKIYDRVKPVIEGSPDVFKPQIAELKQLVSEVMQLSVSIQAREDANKTIIMNHFANLKKEIYNVKNSRKVAQNYYNTMNRINMVDPQFLDKRK